MHRIVTDLAWLVAGTYLALVILRELSLVSADVAPSFSRAIEFGIGTGGSGAGKGA